ncbi:MAG: AAA family ATPase [Planctomycetaceae bacterium]|nr:AAA family ATPase [Planctomycetaceae bacterium]
MTLASTLQEHIRAAFSGLYIQTVEPEDALSEIATLCHAQAWRLATWDLNQGLTIFGAAQSDSAPTASDPLAAIRSLAALANSESPTLLVLRGFHRFLGSAEIVQALEQQLHLGKTQQTFVVILAPLVQLPAELERLFVTVEHDLPSREQLAMIARGVATEERELPSEQELAAVLDAASGLTRYEAEGAFALSLVRHGELRPETLWQLKSSLLRQSGLLQLHRGGETFEQLGGLDGLKAFCRQAMRPAARRAGVRPRGILLLGVPGTGKSAFAKALGTETNRPILTLDVGALLGGIVGETERNVRQALRIADAMAPCVLFIDEVEKGLSGVASSGSTDSGVTARLFGTLLTWLNDHASDVFVVATANDVQKLPPEFSRAERMDGVFFLDLPSPTERQAIWQLYRQYYQLDATQCLPNDDGWTGAEIRACCRLATLLDVPLVEAAQQIVPVAITAAETIERLRNWASGRCLSAQQAGIYRREAAITNKPRRTVRRDLSNN